jgi:hypothetical protein
MGNPQRYSVVKTNVIRTQAIMNYKMDMIDLEKCNANTGAAKFNRILDLLDDELSLGSEPSDIRMEHHDINPPMVAPSDQGHYFQHETIEEDEEKFEDDISKLSKDLTVATLRQEKQSNIPTQRSPMQARKWRSLAAAAKQRDSQKKPSGKKVRKGMSVDHCNKTYAI